MKTQHTLKTIKELKVGDIITCFGEKYSFRSRKPDNGRYIGLNLMNLKIKKLAYYSFHDTKTFEVEVK